MLANRKSKYWVEVLNMRLDKGGWNEGDQGRGYRWEDGEQHVIQKPKQTAVTVSKNGLCEGIGKHS